MNLNYATGAGYIYQWLVATYIYMILIEDTYHIQSEEKVPENLQLFMNNIKGFNEKCIDKFGNDFNANIKIMLEGDLKCFEDVNILSTNNSGINDNLIFIQVKSKGKKEPISGSSGIHKAIKNFVENINFQKDKHEVNYLFFIFTNTTLAKSIVSHLKSNNVKLYQNVINHIITDNNKRKKTKNTIYPEHTTASFGKEKSKFIIGMLIDMINKEHNDIDLSTYTKNLELDYIKKLYALLSDIKIIFKNLTIIESISFHLLEDELTKFYKKEGFKAKAYDNGKLGGNETEIKKDDKYFLLYKEYKYTYFSDDQKFINQLDSISKGKFIP